MGRRTLLLVASMLVAALATALVWLYIAGADQRASQGQKGLATLVAARDLGAGYSLSLLRPTDVLVVELPAEARPAGAFSSFADLQKSTGTTLSLPVQKNAVLTSAAFSTSTPARAVKGRMVLTLTLADPNRSANLLDVGNSVAIYLVNNETSQKSGAAASLPLVGLVEDSVTVVAVGARTLSRADLAAQGTTTSSTSATALVSLDVSDEQAKRLIAATTLGEVYFTLLGPDAQVNTPSKLDDSKLGVEAAKRR